MVGYRHLYNSTGFRKLWVFSLHVLYAPWLPDLYFW